MSTVEFFIYTFAALVPLVGLWAFFMVYTRRWKIHECGDLDSCDFDCQNCEHISYLLKRQAD